MSEKDLLKQGIKEAIQKVARDKEIQKVGSLSRFSPMKFAKIYYIY